MEKSKTYYDNVSKHVWKIKWASQGEIGILRISDQVWIFAEHIPRRENAAADYVSQTFNKILNWVYLINKRLYAFPPFNIKTISISNLGTGCGDYENSFMIDAELASLDDTIVP